MKKNKLLYLFSLLLLGMFYCCTDERENYDTPSSGKEKMVTFSVRVPGAGPKTYALTEGEENEVKSIAILLFDGTSDNYLYQPIYSNSITTDPGDSRIKTFTVKVPEGTYNMIVLANANTSLNTALGSIAVGDSKSVVLDKLKQSNAGKWDTNSSSGSYIPIPMWGEIQGIAVSSSMPPNVPVTLVRMLAKIDVALTGTAKGKFSLESVRLYNYNDQGYITPDVVTWNYATNVAVAPFIPSTASKPTNPATSPFLYDGTDITPDPAAPGRGLSCTNEIYTFEAAAGSDATLLANTCLVVGGTYTGDAQPTYYRVDLANTTGSGASAVVTYLPVLRNHNYKVNIADVTGTGFNTPSDAFKSRPVNIQASILNWNDATITDIVFDGQYMLGVSQGEFTFTREARNTASSDNILSVTTDYPSGWQVEKIVDATTGANATWLSASATSGAAGSVTTTRLEMSQNNGSSNRVANVHLSAGRLTYIVKVTQLTTANIGISITNTSAQEISMLEFVSTKQDVTSGIQPAAQLFKLSWSPASSDLFFTSTTMGNTFTYSTGTWLDQIPGSGSLTDPSGTKTYNIQPPVITPANLTADPFYERSSIYLYSVSDGLTTANKALTLRQYVYNMVPVVEAVYLMDGTQKSFGVRSNSPFTVTVKTNPNNVVSNVSTSGAPNTSTNGTPVYFDVVDDLTNPLLYQKDAVITIKSPTNLFPDTDVTLNCASGIIQSESNTYIVAANGSGILIPVSRANASMLGNQLGTSEAFTADLVWTDNSNRIAANSNIKMIRAAGSGTGGYVLVMPGSAEGNAVVAIKNSSNKILWSWHIWVTSYAPSSSAASGTFMDRNLGAIGNTAGQVGTKGLLYQWGRKDAFPGSPGVNTGNTATEPNIYTVSGTTSITKTAVTVANNFANSVANPATFYYKTSAPYDWYSNSSTQNDALWGPASKTVYDPCPEGWRVPENGVWSSLTTFNFSWSGVTYGRSNNDVGGFYPAAGYRSYLTGAFSYVGTNGFYWSATVSGSLVYTLSFGTSSFSPSSNDYRALGYSVRCVKE